VITISRSPSRETPAKMWQKALRMDHLAWQKRPAERLNLAIQRARARARPAVKRWAAGWLPMTRFPHRDLSLVYTGLPLPHPYTVHVAIAPISSTSIPWLISAPSAGAAGRISRFSPFAAACGEGGVFCTLRLLRDSARKFSQGAFHCPQPGQPAARLLPQPISTCCAPGLTRRTLVKTRLSITTGRRKNIINRPVSMGGKGFHITGDHRPHHPAPAPPGPGAPARGIYSPPGGRQRI